jgi:hypothetical protein
MRKGLLFFLFVIISFSGYAQLFPSNCSAPDSVKERYKTDAQRLALRSVYKYRENAMNITYIPAGRTDTMLNALILVYNATTMPARDTVTDMLDIHSFAMSTLDSPYKFTMNRLQIYAYETEPWMQDFKNGIIPTSDAVINTFLTDYHLHLDYYNDLTSGLDGVFFISDSNYNMDAVAVEWGQAYFAIGGDVGLTGDGPDILMDTITSNYVQLTYRYGWLACGSGCVYNRYWTFRSNFDCTVDYMGSYGDTLVYQTNNVAEISGKEMSVFPNPFNDKLIIENVALHSAYAIYSLTGALLQQGVVTDATPIDVDLAPGMYILKVKSDEQMQTVRLLKQ